MLLICWKRKHPNLKIARETTWWLNSRRDNSHWNYLLKFIIWLLSDKMIIISVFYYIEKIYTETWLCYYFKPIFFSTTAATNGPGNCLPFRGTWNHRRLLVRFVVPDLWVSVWCFGDRSLSFYIDHYIVYPSIYGFWLQLDTWISFKRN